MQASSPQKADSTTTAATTTTPTTPTKRKNAKESKVVKESKVTKEQKVTKESKVTKEPKLTKDSKATPAKDRTKSPGNSRTSMKDASSGGKLEKTPKKKREDRRSEKNQGDMGDHESGGHDSPSRRGQAKASFPLTRIKMIMKSAPEVNTLGVDAVALTARAAELFVVHLAEQASKKGRASTVDYGDIYRVVHDNPILDFLYDIIPQKVPYKDCLAEMEEADRKRKEEVDEIEI